MKRRGRGPDPAAERGGIGVSKLAELSEAYREAAVRLRLAMEDRQVRAAAGDTVARREGALLRQMLGEMRELRYLAESYYTKPRSRTYTTAGLVAPRVDATKR